MGDCSQEVIAQQEVEIESVKKSEMSIGWNTVKLPNDILTGVTIITTQLVRNANLEKAQLVTNSTLKITQGKHYVSCDITELIEQHDHTCICI